MPGRDSRMMRSPCEEAQGSRRLPGCRSTGGVFMDVTGFLAIWSSFPGRHIFNTHLHVEVVYGGICMNGAHAACSIYYCPRSTGRRGCTSQFEKPALRRAQTPVVSDVIGLKCRYGQRFSPTPFCDGWDDPSSISLPTYNPIVADS